MREFLRSEAGHSDNGAAVAALVAVVVLLIVVLYVGGLFGGVGPREPGIDINIRPGS